MKKILYAAAFLLAVQLGLTVLFNMGGKGYETATPDARLLALESSQIDSVQITDGEGKTLVLARTETGWQLPGGYGAPADSGLVEQLLTRLAGLRQGVVVAASDESARRFKVADDLFERHLVLAAGDQEAVDLYVGTSPAFKQIHARLAGSKEIFAVGLAVYDLETGVDKWLDKTVARVEEKELSEISMADVTLSHKDDMWQLENLTEDGTINGDEVSSLVSRVSNMQVEDVVAPTEAAKYFENPPALAYMVTTKDGTVKEYRFASIATGESDDYVLQIAGDDQYYRVLKASVEPLLAIGRQSLIIAQEPATVGAESMPADSASVLAEDPVDGQTGSPVADESGTTESGDSGDTAAAAVVPPAEKDDASPPSQ